MKPLPLRPLPMQLEPLTDYLERLAHANGYHGLELWSVLNRNSESHSKILSDALNGFLLPEFSGPADRHVEIQVNLYGLQAADFTRHPRRWCPHCLKSQPWFRPVWRLKVAAVCAEHCARLLEKCPSCKMEPTLSSILRGTCECGARFVDVTIAAARRQTRLARTLEASLMGNGVIELETVKITMTAPQIVRLICYIGRLNEGPGLRRPGQLAKLGEIGVSFSIFDEAAILLDNWPEAFWHCLEQHMDASPDDASVRRVFGALYQVLYRRLRDPVNQFLRNAFEAFLLDHWRGELCGRHRLFHNETIMSHYIQGLAKVARANGIGSQTLKRMVHQNLLPAKRFAPTAKRQLITIDANQLSTLIPAPSDYLDLRSTARFLGLERIRLRELVGLGAILADTHPTWRGRNQWHFRRHVVSEFLNELRQAATFIVCTEKNVPLRHVLQCWRVTTAEFAALLTAMKKNEIGFSMPAYGLLRDAVFDEPELRSWLKGHRLTVAEWVSVTTASEILGLKEEVVYELVSRALLGAKLVEDKGRIVRRILLASLEKFEREYVSLASLAKRHNISSNALLKRITVDAATGPRVDGGRQYFFRRDKIDGLL